MTPLKRRNFIKFILTNSFNASSMQLTDEDILRLDDNLPGKLLKFGIKVY